METARQPAYDGSASAFIAGYGTGHGSRDGRYVRSVVIESAVSGPPTGSTAAPTGDCPTILKGRLDRLLQDPK